MSETMGLWNKVCETDPGNTKKVSQRGGFTAICANSQIKRATELWGPCGTGWGYDVEHSTFEVAGDILAVCDVTVWHYPDALLPEGEEPPSVGPIRGCAMLVAKGRVDTDAPKKAMTDALTKGLSHWGFNADVFLGCFDDNKYVAAMTEKYSGTAPAEEAPGAEVTPDNVVGMLQHFSAIGHTRTEVMKMAGVTDESELTPAHMATLRGRYQELSKRHTEPSE